MTEWFGRSTQQWVACETMGFAVRYWLSAHEIIRHDWNLPCCQCTKPWFHVPTIQKLYIDKTVPGLNSQVENRSCPWSARCSAGCLMPHGRCQSVFVGWVMPEFRTLDTAVDGWDCGVCDSLLAYPAHKAICTYLEFTLLPVHGDIFSCLFHTNMIYHSEFGIIYR